MKPFILFPLILTFLPLQACYRIGILPTATPLPLPQELATTPPPEGSQLGGLEGVFISVVSIDGYADEQCYKLYRFYPDGVVLYADLVCFEAAPITEIWSDLDRWFRRENPKVFRGDYYLQDQRIWIRVVSYDYVLETTFLRSFQGEYCNDEMVLQEPAIHYYSGVPSVLTEPVLEYIRLRVNPTESLQTEACHVAGYRVLRRPTVVGERAEYRIRTDAGEVCTLEYIAPDGKPSQAPGTGSITADSEGLCVWNWEVGAVKGVGATIVTIDEIRQEYSIEIR